MKKQVKVETEYKVTLLGRRGYSYKNILAVNEESARKKATKLFPYGKIIDVKLNA